MPLAQPTDNDDSALIQQARSGDTQAFGILYQQYAANIYRFFCSQLRDSLDAEDLTSEVFLRAWRSLPRYRERGYPFSAFLFTIARNALIDYRRKKAKEGSNPKRFEDVYPDDNLLISDQLSRQQCHRNLWMVLNEIREIYKFVLVLRFINGLSTREVAKILNRSEGSIRVMQHRGLIALREKITSGNSGYKEIWQNLKES